MQPIKLENLRELVEAGAVKSAQIVGQKGGFAVVASVGMQQRALGTRQGDVRVFTAADTAIKTLREMGLMQFAVDVTHYQAGTLRAARPDLRNRAREASEALEHHRWVREQVAPVMERLENGTATLHSHDDVWSRVEAHASKRIAERNAAAVKPASRSGARAARPRKG